MRFLEFHHSLLVPVSSKAASLVIIRYLPCGCHIPLLQLALTFFFDALIAGDLSTIRLCRPDLQSRVVFSRLPASFWTHGPCALNPHRDRGRGSVVLKASNQVSVAFGAVTLSR